MTTNLILTIALALTTVNVSIIVWSTIRLLRAHRARQQLEEQQEFEAARQWAARAAMIRALGMRLLVRVEPSEIRAGDEITFQRTHPDGCPDNSVLPVTYEAGFHGDTGNLTGGVHLRPTH